MNKTTANTKMTEALKTVAQNEFAHTVCEAITLFSVITAILTLGLALS